MRVLQYIGLSVLLSTIIYAGLKGHAVGLFALALVTAVWVLALLAENRELEDAKDNAYYERNQVVQALGHVMDLLGYRVGLATDEEEGDEWPVLFINLPRAGQVSWHLPKSELVRLWREYKAGWDGHTTEVKYQRLRKFIVYWRGDDVV